MKGKPQPSLYFSAYPLKAIIPSSDSNGNQQRTPYLRSVLSGKTRASSKVRVMPMINPYALKSAFPTQVKPAKQVEGSGDAWFSHYE